VASRTGHLSQEWALLAFRRILMQLNLVAVRVGEPGLPALVGAEGDVGDLHAAGAKLGDGGVEVFDLEADVLVGLIGGGVGDVTPEELDEAAPAEVEVDSEAFSAIVDKVKGGSEPQLVAVEGEGSIEVANDKTSVR